MHQVGDHLDSSRSHHHHQLPGCLFHFCNNRFCFFAFCFYSQTKSLHSWKHPKIYQSRPSCSKYFSSHEILHFNLLHFIMLEYYLKHLIFHQIGLVHQFAPFDEAMKLGEVKLSFVNKEVVLDHHMNTYISCTVRSV